MAEAQIYEVAEPTAPLRQAPSPEAPLDTEALKGERVVRLDRVAGRLVHLAAMLVVHAAAGGVGSSTHEIEFVYAQL